MADGHRQVYDDSIIAFLGIRGYEQQKSCDNCNCRYYRDTYNRTLFSQKQTKTGGLIMGAIAVSITVTVIAIVGLIYFTWQDKKEAKRAAEKKAKQA